MDPIAMKLVGDDLILQALRARMFAKWPQITSRGTGAKLSHSWSEPSFFIWLLMAAATTSRGCSSSVKRSPAWLRSTAPSPRQLSEIKKVRPS